LKIRPHAKGGYYTTYKKKFIYGATPEIVEQKYYEIRYKDSRGHDIRNNPTLEEYMIKWYSAYKKGEGALKTQEMYRNCINNHINPALGKRRVKDITSTEVQLFLKSIKSSKSLAHKVRITLNQIFKAAVADKLRDFNPVTNTKIIAPDNPQREFLSDDQRELLLDILQGHRMYPLIYTMLYTGMRRGEALALTWSDISFDNKSIHVSKSTEYDGQKPKKKVPKTENSYRDIPMSNELIEFLQGQKKKSKSIYVFPGHAGGPMGLTELKNQWAKAKKKIEKWFEEHPDTDIEPVNLTSRLLRHTFCTALYDAGIDELTASRIMGHDVSTMRKIYTHISEHRKKVTVEKIETIYKSKNSSLPQTITTNF